MSKSRSKDKTVGLEELVTLSEDSKIDLIERLAETLYLPSLLRVNLRIAKILNKRMT